MTRVLVVDDNPQDRVLVRRAVLAELEDADVVEAGDPATLQAQLSGSPFDAVVTDFRLRWSDGLEVLKAVHDRHPETPVVMFTNTGSEEVAASGLRLGLSDYIIKAPGGYARVAHAVRYALQRARVKQLEAEVLAREQDARRSAEEANRIKDEFLATVSHELRTPLHAVTGWFQVLKSQQKDATPAAMRAVEAVERNIAMLTRVVEDLMDNARILSRKLTLAPQPTSVEAAVRSAIEGVGVGAAQKNIAIRMTLDSPLPPVWADPTRLHQVFWNLLANAVKFTPDEGRVGVNLREEDGVVVATIVDSGQGISAEFLPRVFDRFSQEDAGNTRAFPGLGLGLALVRHVVEAHHGSVEAQSEGSGKGATFVVRLPAVSDQAKARLPA
jgi:signal transduction histidine kinase